MVLAKMTSALFHPEISFFVIFLQSSWSVEKSRVVGGELTLTERDSVGDSISLQGYNSVRK